MRYLAEFSTQKEAQARADFLEVKDIETTIREEKGYAYDAHSEVIPRVEPKHLKLHW